MYYNIIDHGAVGDGETNNTLALQAAIDAAHDSGGGKVIVPPGRYVTGTLQVKSHVHIELLPGSQILASLNYDDFPSLPSKYPAYKGAMETEKSIIHAEDAVEIAITGSGIIDGRAYDREIEYGFPSFSIRPRMMHLVGCRKVRVRDITIKNSTSWTSVYCLCQDVVVDGITIDSRENDDITQNCRYHRYWPGLNQDGIDVDSCKNVSVSNCHVVSGDDSICIKSRHGLCENVVVTNCTASSNASGIRIGNESSHGFRNVTIGNCSVFDTRIVGIDIAAVHGGACDNIRIHDITMHNVKAAAILVRLGLSDNLHRPPDVDDTQGSMSRISISGVIGTAIGGHWGEHDYDFNRIGCVVAGIPDKQIEGLSLRDIDLEFIGGGSTETCLEDIPEMEDHYPMPAMFGGDLPAYGLYCRHVNDLRLDGLRFTTAEPDNRPAIVLDDVKIFQNN
jgi:polygalacturonase